MRHADVTKAFFVSECLTGLLYQRKFLIYLCPYEKFAHFRGYTKT
jgi:hypothetical protein